MASTTATAKYPKRLQVPVSQAVWDRIEREAGDTELSLAEVGRTYLEAGMQAADEAASE